MNKNIYIKIKNYLPLLIIFILALSVRLYGLNWDQGNHLHPDERFLTMVTNDIKLPVSIRQYFNNSTSPLNPYNYPNYQFFVYGTFPIFLTKVVSVILNLDDYGNITLVGRSLSAVFDSLNIILLFFLAKKLFKKNEKLIYLPSLLYSTCVLPLQLSHFYAVDTFLNFFILATFTLFLYNFYMLAGVFFGLAIACKISAIYFAPIIAIFYLKKIILEKNYIKTIFFGFCFCILTFVMVRIFQPYIFDGIFKLNNHFVSNIRELKAMSAPSTSFPPAVQWASKIPLLNSIQNIFLWGLGLPLSFLFFISLTKIKFKQTPFAIYLSLLWIIILYLYQGSQFAHTVRYFLPIYSFIILVTTYFLNTLDFIKLKSTINILIFCHLIFCIMFLSIYSRPHSRVQASFWIYEHLPVGANITNESWDDPLPLYLPGHDPYIYHGAMLDMYDPDIPQKWAKVGPLINSAGYMIMSSNRLWGSIPLVPDHYPKTSKFYRDLFAQNIGFNKLIEINSYPGFTLPIKNCIYLGPSNFPGITNPWFTIDSNCLYPGIYLRDDIAEEAFTVYDHPKVLIFARANN